MRQLKNHSLGASCHLDEVCLYKSALPCVWANVHARLPTLGVREQFGRLSLEWVHVPGPSQFTINSLTSPRSDNDRPQLAQSRAEGRWMSEGHSPLYMWYTWHAGLSTDSCNPSTHEIIGNGLVSKHLLQPKVRNRPRVQEASWELPGLKEKCLE